MEDAEIRGVAMDSVAQNSDLDAFRRHLYYMIKVAIFVIWYYMYKLTVNHSTKKPSFSTKLYRIMLAISSNLRYPIIISYFNVYYKLFEHNSVKLIVDTLKMASDGVSSSSTNRPKKSCLRDGINSGNEQCQLLLSFVSILILFHSHYS